MHRDLLGLVSREVKRPGCVCLGGWVGGDGSASLASGSSGSSAFGNAGLIEATGF